MGMGFIQQSESIDKLATALNKVQGEKLFALLDKTNPFFKSKYADLSSVWSVAREPLTENGLSVVQVMANGDSGDPIVITQLMHVSGQWIRGKLEIPMPKKDPQAMGSCITYGRRYSLCSILGICPDDDDGNYASGKPVEKKPARKQTKTVQIPPDMEHAVSPKLGTDANCTKAQYGKLVVMAKENSLTKEELEKLVTWYREGEKLSKQEASTLIEAMGDPEKFQEMCENYMEDLHFPRITPKKDYGG